MDKSTLDDIREIKANLREIKAILAQLGAVRVTPTADQEIAACRAQGVSIAEYFRKKGKAAQRKQREKAR